MAADSMLTEAKRMSAEAEKANKGRCVEGEAVFYLEYDRALIPGHIYSHLGVKEFRISGCCEYHFDLWFPDENEVE